MQTNIRDVSSVSVNEFNVYSRKVSENESYHVVEEGQLQMGEVGKIQVKCACPTAFMRVTSLVQRSSLEGGWEVIWPPWLFKRNTHTLLLRTILHNACPLSPARRSICI